MYQKSIGSYDEIPKGMEIYINNYGCHFNKKLYEEAVKRMYKKIGTAKEYMTPYSKEYVEQILSDNGVVVERNKLYDICYVFTMCASDFLGKSVPDERCQALYVKDLIDDADAVEGFIFNRWYADQMFMNNPIEWEDML